MKILITKLGLFLTVGSPSLYDLHGKSQMNKSQSHETLTLYILEKLRYINYARIRFFFSDRNFSCIRTESRDCAFKGKFRSVKTCILAYLTQTERQKRRVKN